MLCIAQHPAAGLRHSNAARRQVHVSCWRIAVDWCLHAVPDWLPPAVAAADAVAVAVPVAAAAAAGAVAGGGALPAAAAAGTCFRGLQECGWGTGCD